MKKTGNPAPDPEPEMEVYHYSCGNFEALAVARSMNEFCRATGSDRDFSTDTGNERDILLAREAGHGFFLARNGRREPWTRHVSRITLAKQALEQAAQVADGSGNRARIEISTVSGAGGQEHRILVDGEARGLWRRSGPHYVLCDATGRDCLISVTWRQEGGDLVHSPWREKPSTCWMRPWNKPAALRNALQAWEEGQLPPLPEQRAQEARRNAVKAKEEADRTALKRLEPHLDDLRRLLADDPRPEARAIARLLDGAQAVKE